MYCGVAFYVKDEFSKTSLNSRLTFLTGTNAKVAEMFKFNVCHPEVILRRALG